MSTTSENAAMALSDSADGKSGPWHNLQHRTATAILLAAIALPVLWAGGWLFTLAMLAVAFQMNREWEQIVPGQHTGWRIAGVIYVVLPVACILIVRDLAFVASEDAAFYATLYPIALVVTTDIAAFFSGRLIGGPKLAPAISPKKTWAGLLGGMAAAAIVAALLQPFMPWPENAPNALLLGLTVAVLAQMGDLFESWVKRRFQVKDSGTILPGHGGLLDRLDGYLLVLPLYLLLVVTNAELLP